MDDSLDNVASAIGEFVESANTRFTAIEDSLAALAGSGRGRVTEPDDTPKGQNKPKGTGATVLGPVSRRSATFGFNHFGEYAMAVKNACIGHGAQDERLMAAASTFGNESSGVDGGFSVPPDYRATIMDRAFGEDSLISRTNMVPTGSNSLTFPSNMSTPWGTDGIQAFWTGEAQAITETKPKLEQVNVRLHKLAVLVPVSDELLEDAPAMGAMVSKWASEKIDFKLSYSIAWGTGAGMPLGFMNAPALVTQTAETSQVADTIVAANVSRMSARLPAQSRRNAVWLIHPDAEPQLSLMTLGTQPIYLPPGGFRDTPFGSLLGRPVIPHQVCETVGDLGDIMLVDLSQYLAGVKAGGLRAETSIHLYFDQDITAFKFTMRVAGQPWWSAPIASRDGTFTQSPFVALAARA